MLIGSDHNYVFRGKDFQKTTGISINVFLTVNHKKRAMYQRGLHQRPFSTKHSDNMLSELNKANFMFRLTFLVFTKFQNHSGIFNWTDVWLVARTRQNR